MQSFFIGTGAVVASALPYIMTNWFGISNTAPEGIIPESVKFSFYIGGAAFFLAVLWTVLRTKEYSPDELREFNSENISEFETLIEDQKIFTSRDKLIKNGLLWTFTGIFSFLISLFISIMVF